MPSIHKALLPAAVVLALVLAGCSAKVGSSGNAAAQVVSVAVSPEDSTLTTGQSGQFAATVTGTADVAVTWAVDEANGGQVDASGLYTAPGAEGVYHVRAVSHADPAVSGTAVVTVVAPPPGSVVISPKTVNVTAGGTYAFTATTTDLASSAVTWSLQESGCGSVSSTGVFTAPTSARTCHVVATSAADSTKTSVATVTVTAPVAITLSPTTRTIDACTTLTLAATVTGSSDQSVTWKVTESGGGTVSSAGVYTAPSTAGTYHVVATAHASSAATATATVTVQDHVLSVALNPTSARVAVNGAQQFAATVTTTCGAFVATGP
jgi:hypothetical protein